MKATVKLQKTGNPIRPIMNWKECPWCELAKTLKILNNKVALPNLFNVKDSKTLTQELANMEIDEHIQLCSFDIENMCINIPVGDLQNIIRNIIARNSATTNAECTEILNLLELIIQHNYIYNTMTNTTNRTKV
jgi:hypothetical protein